MSGVTEKSFLHDVRDHVIEVIRDDGVHRHIRFREPGTMCMHFDLITWPGYLCYTGDMGTYVFSRLTDMFEFFRTDRDSPWLKSKGLTLGINPSYWGEKLQAVDRADGYREWSQEKFKLRLRDIFDQWAAGEGLSDALKSEAWEEVEQDVIWSLDDGGKEHAYTRAHECSVLGDKYRPFDSFYEIDTDEYSYRFMWCCYALAWGIKTYDDSKVAQEVSA